MDIAQRFLAKAKAVPQPNGAVQKSKSSACLGSGAGAPEEPVQSTTSRTGEGKKPDQPKRLKHLNAGQSKEAHIDDDDDENGDEPEDQTKQSNDEQDDLGDHADDEEGDDEEDQTHETGDVPKPSSDPRKNKQSPQPKKATAKKAAAKKLATRSTPLDSGASTLPRKRPAAKAAKQPKSKPESKNKTAKEGKEKDEADAQALKKAEDLARQAKKKKDAEDKDEEQGQQSDESLDEESEAQKENEEEEKKKVTQALARADTQDIQSKEQIRKAYKARKERFYRSFKSPRTPAEIKDKYNRKRSCPETMAILWEEWLGSSEDWKKSQYAIRLSRSHSYEKIGARRWMTFKQICQKYDDTSIAESIRESKRKDPQLARDHVKPHPDCPDNPAMELYLVWDSESEVTKDGTLLESCMRADDSSSASPSRHERKTKKTKKRKKSTSSSVEETSEESKSKSEQAEKKGKKASKERKSSKRNVKKAKKRKVKKETEEEKLKREKKEAEREQKKQAEKERRAQETKQRKEYNEKVAAARKVANALTSKIGDVRTRERRAASLSAELQAPIMKNLDQQRRMLQSARDALQNGIDKYEEEAVNKLAEKGNQALDRYKAFLEKIKV